LLRQKTQYLYDIRANLIGWHLHADVQPSAVIFSSKGKGMPASFTEQRGKHTFLLI
jgi:hypothetical protein